MLSTPRLVALLLILLLVASGLMWLYSRGGDSALLNVERQTNESGDQADRARSDYSWCIRSGGVYDFGTGKCGGAAARRGN